MMDILFTAVEPYSGLFHDIHVGLEMHKGEMFFHSSHSYKMQV